MFTQMKSGSHPTWINDLRGKRLAVFTELPVDANLDVALIKRLTGRDAVRARGMRENFDQFSPTHKLVITSNPKPGLPANDPALWRRIHLVAFRAHFWDRGKGQSGPVEMQAIKGFESTLQDELPGVLNRALRGCLEWQDKGLSPPDSVLSATKDLRDENDIIKRFLNDCVIRQNDDADSRCFREPTTSVYDAFQKWCGRRQTQQNRMSRREVYEAIEDAGHPRKKFTGCEHFVGMRLIRDASESG